MVPPIEHAQMCNCPAVELSRTQSRVTVEVQSGPIGQVSPVEAECGRFHRPL
jgi:hypothetical protein